MAEKKEVKKTGRPKKVIDKEQFKKLCAIQCTLLEIAGWFDCSDETINNWCKRNYGESFLGCFKKFSAGGKISLRRNQFKLAESSAAMAIFLGKNYLGQTDSVDSDISEEETAGALNAIAKALEKRECTFERADTNK